MTKEINANMVITPISEPILQLKKLDKHFPGVQALSDVNFDIRPAEVHALVGENGAGKSTLIKIISGVYQPDQGEIYFDGHPVHIQNPRHAQNLGVATIYQEAALYPDLNVVENIFMDRQPLLHGTPVIDWKQMRQHAAATFHDLEVEMNLDTQVSLLSVAEQEMVQIAKALLQYSRMLILDEPTAALTDRETRALFRVIRLLRDRGVAILYISHRIEEVFSLADRVTILRDGQIVSTRPIHDLTYQGVIKMMVGRELNQLYPRSAVRPGKVILRVDRLNQEGIFEDISFELHEGEILGMAGLIGAGRTEIAHALFGIASPNSGSIYIDEMPFKTSKPWDSLEAGLAYLPEDRKSQGVVAPMSLRANISIAVLKRLCTSGIINIKAERYLAEEYIRKLSIRTPGPDQMVANLSGGNQQKVIIARWLAKKPHILILDEPTRGIDVGAKAEIHRLMDQLASQGMGIIMISSELPEILGMSDRILVLREGHIVGELSRAEATQEGIMALATDIETSVRS
jgi:ABC-type sugar transport system ATPase subunit